MTGAEKSPEFAGYDDDFIGEEISRCGCLYRQRPRRGKGGLNCWERIPGGGGGGGGGKKGWVARRLNKAFSRRLGECRDADMGRAGRGRFGYDPISYSLNFDESYGRDFSMRFAAPMGLGRDRPVVTADAVQGKVEADKMDYLSYTKAALPFAAMVAVEVIEMGLVTVSKAAMTRGMSSYVFVVYYNALGTLILLPFFVRNYLSGKRPSPTFQILCKLFLLGFIGICLLHICLYAGIRYIPPALAAAIGNMIPAYIFLLAIIFRMEKLEIRKAISQVKVLGTIVSIAGVFIVSFYKGPPLLTAQTLAVSPHLLLSDQSKWSLGCLIIAVTCLLASIRVVFQAAIVKEFPDEMTIVFFFSFFGTIQSAIVSFFLVTNSSAWKMTRRVEIISVVYAALTITILYNCIVTWCLRVKGPVYVAMFKPLSIAIAAVMGFLFLGDALYLGSVTGTIIIVAGFYAFMWAKTKESNTALSNVSNLESVSTQKDPLLSIHE